MSKSEQDVPERMKTFYLTEIAGLHAALARKLALQAGRFTSEITVSKKGHEVNGKSMIALLMLQAQTGSEIMLYAKGEDAAEAIDKLTEVLSPHLLPKKG